LETAGRPTAAVDRVDRLSLIRSILEAGGSDEPTTLSSDRSRAGDPQRIEQIRTDVEAITNFHPDRLAAWGETADKIDEPIDDEAETILETGLGAERELRERTTKAVSETALLRRATRSITATNGSAWAEAFPEIERLTLLGLSSLSAPHTDLVHGLLAATSLTVHVHFREGTGEYLRGRVPDLLAITDPGTEAFE